MTTFDAAFSNTSYYVNKRYRNSQGIPYDYQSVRFSPYLDNQYSYKFYIPVLTKILSFDVLLNEPSGISQYLLFVLRYKSEPSTNYSQWSFLEGSCTVSYVANKYEYVFPYKMPYDYIYSFPNSSLARNMNPLNLGGLGVCREQDHKIKLIDSKPIRNMNIFHMKNQSYTYLKESGQWMYIHIIAGKNFAREMLINMYF